MNNNNNVEILIRRKARTWNDFFGDTEEYSRLKQKGVI